jgi:hypothetical protein
MIEQLLDKLADYQAQRDAINLREQDAIDRILTPDILAQIEDIKTEYAMQRLGADENIAALEAEVKAAVLTEGKSVKGAYLQAVWSKGRVSWDSKALDGMIAIIPQIATARKEGAPSVSIRKIG